MFVTTDDIKQHGGNIKVGFENNENRYGKRYEIYEPNSCRNTSCTVEPSVNIIHILIKPINCPSTIYIPIFKFDNPVEMDYLKKYGDSDNEIVIDDNHLILVNEASLKSFFLCSYELNTLYMFNRYIFGVHWKKWISLAGYTLRIQDDN